MKGYYTPLTPAERVRRRRERELKRLGPEARAKYHTPWSAEEDRILEDAWGEFGIETISKRVKRTLASVEQRARDMGLRGHRHGLLRIGTLERMTGYERCTITTAIKVLGIPLLPLPATMAAQHRRRRAPGGKKPMTHYGIDEDQYAALLAYLVSRKEGSITVRPGITKGRTGAWNVCGRASACSGCARSDKPHYAKGMCMGCYDNKRRSKGTVWGKDGRPPACVGEGCGTTERDHFAKGLCKRCYSPVQKRAKALEKKGSDNGRQAAE